MIKAYSKGAVEEVTGSRHYIEADGATIQVDCGAYQGRRLEAYNKNKDADFDEVDAVLLTHAHYDHCGLLPYMVKKGYKGNIYATSATRDLANIIMLDSAKIQAGDYDVLQKGARKKKENKDFLKPLFTEDDCIKATNQIHTLPYYQRSRLTDSMDFQLFDAGHILGSSMVELYIREKAGIFGKMFGRKFRETRVLFTGDLGRPEKPIIRAPDTNVDAPDYIYLESTYGNREHEKVDVALDELARTINDTARRGGKVIIPSFAIERTQEIIYYLHILTEQKKIPKLPIYVDSPMATNATSIFQVHPECYADNMRELFLSRHKNPFHFGKLTFVTTMQQSKRLDMSTDPMIIISADGMCEAGRVTYHLAAGISDPKNTVLMVGYMAENTLGRKLLDGEKNVKIVDSMYEVKADIRKINAFSAHADYTEIISWLGKIDTSRLKRIFLVHGEKDAQEGLVQHLHDAGYRDVEIVRKDEVYKL